LQLIAVIDINVIDISVTSPLTGERFFEIAPNFKYRFVILSIYINLAMHARMSLIPF